MLPCELIERNGDALARAVADTARRWGLGDAFLRWLDEACLFTNTLVDRIVTGYPKDEAAELTAQLGYEDQLLVTGEVFHSWVIESRRPLEAELPFVGGGPGRDLDGRHDAVPRAQGPHPERRPHDDRAGRLSRRQGDRARVHGRSADPFVHAARHRGGDPADADAAARRSRRVRAQRDRTVLEPVHQALPAQHLAQLRQQVQGAHPRARCSTTSASRGGCRRG